MPAAPWSIPAWGWRVDPALALPALVRNHTLDARAAVLLWLAAERRASIVVAGGPRLAGKTTLLAAYRDLLPPHTEPVYTRGVAEDFGWVGRVDLARAYVLVNELSDHTPHYLWLPHAPRLLELMAEGYHAGIALHAETSEEVLDYLASPPLSATPGQLATLHLIATIAVGWGPEDIVRRLASLALVVLRGSAVALVPLVQYVPHRDEWQHVTEPEVLRLLEGRLGLAPSSVEGEVERRRATLLRLIEEGCTDRSAMQAALRSMT